jgi:prepilin-type N-terminal cleavage/methylation domain-containing protein
MNKRSGMSLVEMMMVMAIFSMVILVVYRAVYDIQTMHSGGMSQSMLETEALKIVKRLSTDLQMSAAMHCPTSSGLTYTDLLPHIDISGTDAGGASYGENLVFLIPSFQTNGQPNLLISATDLGVDWGRSKIVRYTPVNRPNGRRALTRTTTDVYTGVTSAPEVLTEYLQSIEFRDKESDSDVDSYYTIKYVLTLRQMGVGRKLYYVRRGGYFYLRNSRGSEDL